MNECERSALFAAGIALLLAVQTAQAAEASPADALLGAARVLVGTPAPAVQLETIDGERIDLAALRGDKAVYDLEADSTMQALAASTKLDVGDSLPAVTVNAGNETIALNDPPPHGTVLVFMTPWCESYLASTRPEQSTTCRRVREQVERLKARHPGLRWLGIASGIWTVPQDLTAYSREHAVTMPLTLDADGALFRGFGVMRVPTIIIADGSGRIVKRVDGYDTQLDDVVSVL